jgi:hypothetical protein
LKQYTAAIEFIQKTLLSSSNYFFPEEERNASEHFDTVAWHQNPEDVCVTLKLYTDYYENLRS